MPQDGELCTEELVFIINCFGTGTLIQRPNNISPAVAGTERVIQFNTLYEICFRLNL